jgi:hypothetical protein
MPSAFEMSPAIPITASVKDFCDLSGLPRRSVYTLLKLGALRSIKIGKRRLIVLESYRELIYKEGGGASVPQSSPQIAGDAVAHNGTKRAIRRRGRRHDDAPL